MPAPPCAKMLGRFSVKEYWLLPALKSGGVSKELAVDCTLMALNVGEPFGPHNGSFEGEVLQTLATEIKATASLMKSFLQLPEGVEILNFTFTVVLPDALKLPAKAGGCAFESGGWNPQNLPGSLVPAPEF